MAKNIETTIDVSRGSLWHVARAGVSVETLAAEIARRARGMCTGGSVVTAAQGPQMCAYQAGRYALLRRKNGWSLGAWNAGHGNWNFGGWVHYDAWEAGRHGRPHHKTLKAAATELAEQLVNDACGYE